MARARIHGWKADEDGAGFYRIQQPLTALAQAYPDEWDLTIDARLPESPRPDLIVGQRVFKPDPAFWWKKLRREGRTCLIYEVDDDLFSVDPSNTAAYHLYAQPEAQASIRRCTELADAVSVSTEHLAAVCREYNDRVFVRPNLLEPEVYLPDDSHRDSDQITVGWTGSASHTRDVKGLKWTLQQIAKHPRIRLVIGGAPSIYELVGGREVGAEFVPWTRDRMTYINTLRRFDVGLAPIAPIPFNRSKSALKMIEYGAGWTPCVASDFGPYAEVGTDGVDCRLVTKPVEWRDAILELVEDDQKRRELGRGAHSLSQKYQIGPETLGYCHRSLQDILHSHQHEATRRNESVQTEGFELPV